MQQLQDIDSFPRLEPARRVAVIGGGISGLGAAHRLAESCAVTIFEQHDRLGGHADTDHVRSGDSDVAVDTGFIVFNRRTYPLLTQLFADLDVETTPTSMSFSVTCDGCGCEFAGGSAGQLLYSLARQPRNVALLRGILAFRRAGRRSLRAGIPADLSLRGWAEHAGIGHAATHHYLVPLTASVWSTPPGQALDLPADTTLRFLHNHGLLGGRPARWRTVVGGSERYVRALHDALEVRGVAVHTGDPVTRVERDRTRGDIIVTRSSGARARFDRVVVAVHSDQALELLDDPTPVERDVLGAIAYTPNEVVLHDDVSPLPGDRRLWAAWNYRLRDCDGRLGPAQLSYQMNILQHLPRTRSLTVTVNAPVGSIPAERVLRTRQYAHPRFDLEARQAQQRVDALHAAASETTGTFFCGAWQRWGFHEDGLWSGYRAADAVLESLAESTVPQALPADAQHTHAIVEQMHG